jgi:hypothetical protein
MGQELCVLHELSPSVLGWWAVGLRGI